MYNLKKLLSFFLLVLISIKAGGELSKTRAIQPPDELPGELVIISVGETFDEVDQARTAPLIVEQTDEQPVAESGIDVRSSLTGFSLSPSQDRFIALNSVANAETQVCLISETFGLQQCLPETLPNSQILNQIPTWSSDGGTLYYITHIDEESRQAQLVAYDFATSSYQTRQVSLGSTKVDYPAIVQISASGNYLISVTYNEAFNTRSTVIETSTGTFVASFENIACSSFAPNSDEIAISTRQEIQIVDPTGYLIRSISLDDIQVERGEFICPEWSPSGRYITWHVAYFMENPEHEYGWYIYDALTDTSQLLSHYYPVSNYTWSPDEQFIAGEACSSFPEFSCQVLVINIATGEETFFSGDNPITRIIAWLPEESQ